MQTQLLTSLQSRPEYNELNGILRACVHCGFCNATCPTYQLLGDELDGPRGRIYLMKQMLEGQDVSGLTRQHLDRCLSCRACESTCPSGVRYGRLLDLSGEILEQQIPRSIGDRVLRRLMVSILSHRQRFSLMLTLARLVKPVLPQRWQQKIPALDNQLPSQIVQQHTRKILLLSGCVQPALAPAINAATINILNQLGITAIVSDQEQCCGALSYHLSVKQQSISQIKRNIDNWLPYLDQGVEAIVSTASGCGVMVKEYAEVLQYDHDYADKAARISAATSDISEILQGEDLSKLSPQKHLKVAFQAPCTLQHGQKLTGVVESILTQLGYTLTMVNNAHLCCGSAGVYSLLQPAIAEQLRDDKLSALNAGQADIIATANIGCLQHLQSASVLKVVHWLQLLV